MKRLLPLLLVAGCSATTTAQEPLIPLATTGIATETTLNIPKQTREATFLRNFTKNYPYPNPYSDVETVGFGWLWCQAHEDGMTTTDISDRIELGSNTQQEMDLQKAIVVNAFLDLCPN